MITNDAARKIIMDMESLRLDAYLCPSGIPTIGWGHTGDVKIGDRITRHQAEAIFEYDVARHEEIIRKCVSRPLNENQFSALVSFVFNVGPGKKGVKDGFVELSSGGPSSMLRKLNGGFPLAAANEFDKWTKGKVDGQHVQLPGLVRRRAAEKALFLTPVNRA